MRENISLMAIMFPSKSAYLPFTARLTVEMCTPIRSATSFMLIGDSELLFFRI